MRRSFDRRRRHADLHEIKEINVMPLVDLLLQLFIAVVIFFPVVEYGMNVNLPKGTTDTIKREQTRTLSVDKAGRIYLNDVPKSPQQLTQHPSIAPFQFSTGACQSCRQRWRVYSAPCCSRYSDRLAAPAPPSMRTRSRFCTGE